MRVLFFSDTHLGFDYPVRRRQDAGRRGEDFFINFEKVLMHARDHADVLVHGGDLFHRSVPHPAVVDRAYQLLCDTASSGVRVVIVPGNHERSLLPPSLFLNHPNLHVFDRPSVHTLAIAGECLQIVGVPFTRNAGTFFKDGLSCDLTSAATTGHRLLVFHQAVQGATVGPTAYRFRTSVQNIAQADLPAGFDAFLCGHIHRHQIIDIQGTPLVFCGSTERTSFAEKDEQKGFVSIVMNPGDTTMTFHPLPARKMMEVRVGADHGVRTLRQLVLATTEKPNIGPTLLRVRFSSTPTTEALRMLNDLKAQLTPRILLSISIASSMRRTIRHRHKSESAHAQQPQI